MRNDAYRIISRFAEDMDGVFATADLDVLLGRKTDISLYRAIARLVEQGDLIKVKRGLYAVPDASLSTISGRIDPTAYISTGTVLAKYAVIGSVPIGRVQAVKTGAPRSYKCTLGVIEHLSIKPDLFFGFDMVNGVRQATPEKAFLDVCYYTFKGKAFSFDPASDVNLESLNMQMVSEYLQHYESRFVSFYRKIWRCE